MKRLIGILALVLAIGLTGAASAAPHFNGMGTGQMGAVGTNTTLSSASQFSFAGWVRISRYANAVNLGDQRIVSFGTGSGGPANGDKERAGFGITKTGFLTLNVLSGVDSSVNFQVATGTVQVPLNTWFHAAAVVDLVAGTMTIYKDGAVYASRTGIHFGSTSTSSTPANYAQIGCSPRISYPDQKPIVGNVEDLQIFRTALTAGDVFALTTPGAVGPGVVSHYPLNCLAPDVCNIDANGKYYYVGSMPTLIDSVGGFSASPNQVAFISEPGPTGGP